MEWFISLGNVPDLGTEFEVIANWLCIEIDNKDTFFIGSNETLLLSYRW
jgi:hypothetical protein